MARSLPPLITLEDHYLLKEPPAHLLETYKILGAHNPSLLQQLQDAGSVRLAAMDSGDCSLQVISSTPNLSALDPKYSREANNQIHDAVKAEETRAGGVDGKRRFAGLAVLPMRDPRASADELRRCIKELGCVGALVDNHANGMFYDGSAHDVFWAEAEALDVPVYLHPCWPEQPMKNARYTGERLNDAAQLILSGPGWGWHSDTAVHIFRLFASGLFDRFPRLKIIIGHMGEMIPYQLGRVLKVSRAWGDWKRGLRQVWDENIWITTSGNWSLDPMACMLRNTKVERIMYSVDYPFGNFEAGKGFLFDLRESGLVSEEQFEGICHRNAEKLLGVTAPPRSS